MGSTYIRRFTEDPGLDVLLEIESVNVLDLEPETSISGSGTGTVCVVAEFEDGEFEKTVECSGVADLLKKYGGLGYTYGSARGNYPSAVSRKADARTDPEYWNGNGHIAINAKRFSRLMCCRVDTSVGLVYFTALAFTTGAAAFVYKLETGQTLTFEYDGTPVTTTFTGVAATITGSGGTFPTLFAGGETLTLGYDGVSDFQTTFLSTDQSVAQVVARINQFAGFTFATVSGGQIKLTGIQPGTGGQVRVVSGSTGVLTQLGLTAANTAGTGNVADINNVTTSEINTRVAAASTNNVKVRVDSQGRLRLVNVATPGTGTIQVTGGTATALGFKNTALHTAGDESGVLPAGTRVSNGGTYFVTMKSTTIVAGQQTAYGIKVRHAIDDGTGTGVSSGTVNVLVDVPDVGEFDVVNLTSLNAALTETQLDAAYVSALDHTLGLNDITKEINIIMCARSSNTTRFALKQNAKTASDTGHLGRVGVVRAPMGSDKDAVTGSTTPWGVAATRFDRIIYCYPNAREYVPTIAAKGVKGGTGFTSDGVIDVGAEAFMCSILSQLNPEENPGQETPFLDGVKGIESKVVDTQTLDINDYKRFKAAGIAALRIDNGSVFFQSGVTSVDKDTQPGRVTIARRRMSDYIQDTLARRATIYGKKLMTVERRIAVITDVRTWLDSLVSGPPQRIDGFEMDAKTGNTQAAMGKGAFRVTIKVRTLSSFESIILATEIGEQVTIAEAA